MPTILEISTEFRARLFNLDDALASDIVERYKRVYLGIEAQARELLSQIERLKGEGKPPTKGQLIRLERFGKLESDIESQFRRFGKDMTGLVTTGQERAVILGDTAAARMGQTGITNSASVFGEWHRVPVEAFEHLVGFFQNGSPLSDLFDTFGKAAAKAGREVLEKAVATGINPRQTSKGLSRALGSSLSRSLTVARTEQLRSYREAGTANYVANKDVVQTVTRIAELDELTCIVCIDEHGTVRPIDEPFETHPNCRCTDVPNVNGDDTVIPSGESWFEKQSPEFQRATMGDAKYEAWKAGDISISDLNKRTYDERWGGGRAERSLDDAKARAESRKDG